MYDNKLLMKNILDGIICGDVIEEMNKMIKEREKFDCIYADPDYNVGIKYGTKYYTKKFDEYIDWCIKWSKLAYKLLDNRGNYFIINYPKNNSHLRVKYLDDAFYSVEQYVWIYNANIGHSKKSFTRAHREILHCRKTNTNKFFKENVAVPYENPDDKRIKELIKNGSKGRMPYSWFYFDLVKNVSKDKTIHPCQIPQDLSKLLISSCTKPKDKVLILFGGSGNDVISAINLGRYVNAIEINEKYCELIKNRIRKMDFPLTFFNDIEKEENSIESII